MGLGARTGGCTPSSAARSWQGGALPVWSARQAAAVRCRQNSWVQCETVLEGARGGVAATCEGCARAGCKGRRPWPLPQRQLPLHAACKLLPLLHPPIHQGSPRSSSSALCSHRRAAAALYCCCCNSSSTSSTSLCLRLCCCRRRQRCFQFLPGGVGEGHRRPQRRALHLRQLLQQGGVLPRAWLGAAVGAGGRAGEVGCVAGAGLGEEGQVGSEAGTGPARGP